MSENHNDNKDIAQFEREANETPRQSPLTPEAERALAEAEARRAKSPHSATEAKSPKEIGGRDGPDPVRYGDWENGGITSDF